MSTLPVGELVDPVDSDPERFRKRADSYGPLSRRSRSVAFVELYLAARLRRVGGLQHQLWVDTRSLESDGLGERSGPELDDVRLDGPPLGKLRSDRLEVDPIGDRLGPADTFEGVRRRRGGSTRSLPDVVS